MSTLSRLSPAPAVLSLCLAAMLGGHSPSALAASPAEATSIEAARAAGAGYAAPASGTGEDAAEPAGRLLQSGAGSVARPTADRNPAAELEAAAERAGRADRAERERAAERRFSQRGLASWYGAQFHGRRTASGELYNMHALTAAHPTLPIPSYVRVRNPANGRTIVVRVNDRGPFHGGRVLDLSYGAAARLDLRGVAAVQIEGITFDDIRNGAWREAVADPDGATGDGTAPEDLATLATERLLGGPSGALAAPSFDLAPVDGGSARYSGASRAATGRSGRTARRVGGTDASPAAGRAHDASAAESQHHAAVAVVTGAGAPTVAPAIPGPGAAAPNTSSRILGVVGAGTGVETAAPSGGAASIDGLALASSAAPMGAGLVSNAAMASNTNSAASARSVGPREGSATRLAIDASSGSATEPPAGAREPIGNGVTAAAGTRAGRGFWVELGAFGQRRGAEALQRALDLRAGWLAPLLAVFDESLFKLQAGPFPSRRLALEAAERARAALRLTPLIVDRR